MLCESKQFRLSHGFDDIVTGSNRTEGQIDSTGPIHYTKVRPEIPQLWSDGQLSTFDFFPSTFRRYKSKLRNSEKFCDIDEELQNQFLDFYHKFQSSFDGFDDWHNVSCDSLTDYRDCGGDQLLNWKDCGYKTVFKLLEESARAHVNLDAHILFGKCVVRIDYGRENVVGVPYVRVECADGSVYDANHVICTVSLGVLKAKHSTLFQPTLSLAKRTAIEDVSIGACGKIFVEFESAFWPTKNWQGFGLLWQNDEDLSEFFALIFKPTFCALGLPVPMQPNKWKWHRMTRLLMPFTCCCERFAPNGLFQTSLQSKGIQPIAYFPFRTLKLNSYSSTDQIGTRIRIFAEPILIGRLVALHLATHSIHWFSHCSTTMGCVRWSSSAAKQHTSIITPQFTVPLKVDGVKRIVS